ncbi:MAG: 30S ribosomal protein S12 methylthiotransferase RimO [Chitinispirillaceae bacterium]|nr:30S ribosomal protein S12 methylthiotransferase RimO [Chitinispirillaceae bacterium]
MHTFALHNLGCSKNQIDGERIAHLFSTAGYEIVADLEKADVIVVNTCAFIREAQEEAIEAILESASFKKSGRCRTLIVSGCFSERYRERVAKDFPEVDLWTGVHDWEKILKRELRTAAPHPFERELSFPGATQYLKIAEGCSHACSYCVIPRLRGKYRSRSMQEIIKEAQWLESKGVKELILVAQDTSFYGRDIGTDLPGLLKKLLTKTSFPWVRLMYLHPAHVADALLRLFASEKRLCPYFDMPLQHIADPVLKAMNRYPRSKGIRQIIGKIRALVPGAALRSTFILGFPGEDQNHFRELTRFVEEVKFDRLGVFPWSPEEGTPALRLPGRPRPSTAARRCETLMLLQREISRELLERRTGSAMEVIIDGPSDDPAAAAFQGRTRLDAPELDGKVFLKDSDCITGSIVKVKITGSSDYDLFGELS